MHKPRPKLLEAAACGCANAPRDPFTKQLDFFARLQYDGDRRMHTTQTASGRLKAFVYDFACSLRTGVIYCMGAERSASLWHRSACASMMR